MSRPKRLGARLVFKSFGVMYDRHTEYGVQVLVEYEYVSHEPYTCHILHAAPLIRRRVKGTT